MTNLQKHLFRILAGGGEGIIEMPNIYPYIHIHYTPTNIAKMLPVVERHSVSLAIVGLLHITRGVDLVVSVEGLKYSYHV